MRRWKLFALLAFVASLAVVSTTVSEEAARAKSPRARVNPKRVLHVVAFKFKEGTTQEQIDKVCRDFRDLRDKIPQILKYQAGVNISSEKLNKGFSYIFILTFKNTKARDTYLIHPAHKEFAQRLRPLLDDVFVIDFEAQ